MAGLLDSIFNTPEGRLGLGLLAMSGPQSRPMGAGERIASAFQQQDDYKRQQQADATAKNQAEMQREQFGMLKQKNAQELAQQQRKQSLIQGLLGEGALDGVSTGGMEGTATGGGIKNLTPSQVAALQLGGVDIESLWKTANEGFKREGGAYYNMPGRGTEFFPNLEKGMAVQNGQVVPAPGFNATNASIEGSKAAAVAAANAPHQIAINAAQQNLGASLMPQEVYNPNTGQMEIVSRARAVAGVGQPPSQNQRYPGPGLAGGSAEAAAPEQLRYMQAELDKLPPGHPDIPAIQREMQRLGGGAPQSQAPTSGNFAAAPPLRVLSAGKAADALNNSWIAKSYEPTLKLQESATQTLANVKIARDSLEGIGSTGWGTDTRAQAANILTSLGLSSGNAKMLATNSQTFQNAAIGQLQATLTSMTGIATDKDEARVAKMFASLSNTPDANRQILDLLEAKSALDIAKAKFYQAAMPAALQDGDLTAVDREWGKRAPSIFSMPSMKKWGNQ